MGTHFPARNDPFPDRIAFRRKLIHSFVGMVLCLTFVGCRSTGIRPSTAETTGITDETPSRKNSLSASRRDEDTAAEKGRAASALKRPSPAIAARSGRKFVDDDQIASRYDEDIGDDEGESSRTNRKRSVSEIVQTAARANRKQPKPGTTESLIEIIRFNDGELVVDETARSRVPTPKRLPSSSDEPGESLRLPFPKNLPGAFAPDLEFSESDDDHPEFTERKLATIDRLFPIPTVPRHLDAPQGRSMTLEELEELALQNNPTIVQAQAAIIASQGLAIQAGVSPNPTVGYEADTFGSGGTRNYQGISISQPFKTAGKLTLQRGVANVSVMNAELVYERTKLDVLRQVRTAYYNVLVAQEAMKINEALVTFSIDVFKIMRNRLKGDELAGYEQSQLKTLVDPALGAYIGSQNTYITAWKQIAVATGRPELPMAILEGRVDMPVPNLNYDALLDWVLSVHPDLHASRNLESQSKLNLELQKRIPISDIVVSGVFQNDFTSPGFGRTSYNLNTSMPLPLFDRNQGNIRNAQGQLTIASQQYAVTKNALTGQLADAFGRYQTARYYSEIYRNEILPNMARAYRGVFKRYNDNSDKVAFGDIIVAQQNLAAGISAYIGFLSQQWLAAVDIANWTQLRNFRELFPAGTSIADEPFDESSLPAPAEGVQP